MKIVKVKIISNGRRKRLGFKLTEKRGLMLFEEYNRMKCSRIYRLLFMWAANSDSASMRNCSSKMKRRRRSSKAPRVNKTSICCSSLKKGRVEKSSQPASVFALSLRVSISAAPTPHSLFLGKWKNGEPYVFRLPYVRETCLHSASWFITICLYMNCISRFYSLSQNEP